MYADPNDVTLTAASYCDVDGTATIRADTVVYSTVTNGGGYEVWDGIALNPMYAEVGDQETVHNMYQYVPSKVGHPIVPCCVFVALLVNMSISFIFS